MKLMKPCLTRPVLWKGDIIESAKPSVQVKVSKSTNSDLGPLGWHEVNDTQGRASDLMSSLKSSDWDHCDLF